MTATAPRHMWNEQFLQRIRHLLSRDDMAWGSRTPLPETPEWVTLDVVQGGFASGSLLAGGSLLEWEREAAEQLGLSAATSAEGTTATRATLNAHFMTEQGLQELQQRLATGCYKVAVPEEGALLAIAWLLGQGRQQEAAELVETLAPWFSTLRFYPRPADHAPNSRQDLVHLCTVDDTRAMLRSRKVPRHITLQEQAYAVWRPLLDDAMLLLLETVQSPPHLVSDPQGEALHGLDGLWAVQGGFPGEVYPEGWDLHATALLQRAGSGPLPAAKRHRLTRALGFLRHAVRRCASDGGGGADVRGPSAGERAKMRASLAYWAQRRGLPGSLQQQAAVAFDTRKVSETRRLPLATCGLLQSLAPFPGDAGCPAALDDLFALALGANHSPLADSLRRKVQRCLDLPLEQHVQLGSIPSAEVLAAVLLQVTGRVAAAAMAARAVAPGAEPGGAQQQQAEVERLLAALYAAFRHRRSLLLLDLRSQVQFEELPWVSALTRLRGPDQDAAAGPAGEGEAAAARQLLKQIALLFLRRFPGCLLPNKLLQELRAVARAARLTPQQLPLVEELAADIFMLKFTPKFTAAAHAAARLLQGTLYERYYAIRYKEVLDIPVPAAVGREEEEAEGLGPMGSETEEEEAGGYERFMEEYEKEDDFTELCKRRAKEAAALEGEDSGGSWVVKNGRILEQEQILTMHNLAALVVVLELQAGPEQLQPRQLAEGAWRAAARLVVQARRGAGVWRLKLRLIKDAAYAWRNMVFFLSLLPPEEQAGFVAWAAEQLQCGCKGWLDVASGEVLQQALQGLRQAQEGEALEGLRQAQQGAAAEGGDGVAGGDGGGGAQEGGTAEGGDGSAGGDGGGGAARVVLGWARGDGHWMLAGVERTARAPRHWPTYDEGEGESADGVDREGPYGDHWPGQLGHTEQQLGGEGEGEGGEGPGLYGKFWVWRIGEAEQHLGAEVEGAGGGGGAGLYGKYRPWGLGNTEQQLGGEGEGEGEGGGAGLYGKYRPWGLGDVEQQLGGEGEGCSNAGPYDKYLQWRLGRMEQQGVEGEGAGGGDSAGLYGKYGPWGLGNAEQQLGGEGEGGDGGVGAGGPYSKYCQWRLGNTEQQGGGGEGAAGGAGLYGKYRPWGLGDTEQQQGDQGEGADEGGGGGGGGDGAGPYGEYGPRRLGDVERRLGAERDGAGGCDGAGPYDKSWPWRLDHLRRQQEGKRAEGGDGKEGEDKV